MSVTKEMFAAGFSCSASSGILNGFETTKVKLQLHDPARPAYRRPTTAGVMAQIAREEGVLRGLVRPGLTASCTRAMLYDAYRVGLYSSVRDGLSGRGSGECGGTTVDGGPTLRDRVLAGVFTGGLGSMLACPLDVVRARLQADSGIVRKDGTYATGLRRGEPVRYRGMVSALVIIMQQEGLRSGLYRGATVTVTRASVFNGSQLASYDTFKRWLGWEEGPILHLTCALASGVVAQTVIMPIDTVKSNIMLGHGWKTIGECLRRSGPLWLYRGYLPACAGQGLGMLLQMPLIEEVRRLLGLAAI